MVAEPSRYVYRGKFAQATATAGIAMCAGAGLAIALDPTAPPYLGGLVAMFGGYLSWMAGWQSSVRLRRDGVVVDNMFMRGFVPWHLFREFRVANGLKIVMTDGRLVGSFAFGGSLAGQLSGYRRMRRVAQSMEAARQALAAEVDQSMDQSNTGPSRAERSVYRLRAHFELWPLLALLVPLELLGLLTSMLK